MDNLDYNTKAINDIYKNAHIAMQSIADLLPAVENFDIKKELQNQYDGYNNDRQGGRNRAFCRVPCQSVYFNFPYILYGYRNGRLGSGIKILRNEGQSGT